jgi:hypothetical protein
MAKKRQAAEPVDRAVEYIDSPRMIQRLRYGDQLSAVIFGNYGVYRTGVQIGKSHDAQCTCPSEPWPCKHARALYATWECRPETFFDVQAWLDTLKTKSKADLLKLIGAMAVAAPPALSAGGIEGFGIEVLEESEFFDQFE